MVVVARRQHRFGGLLDLHVDLRLAVPDVRHSAPVALVLLEVLLAEEAPIARRTHVAVDAAVDAHVPREVGAAVEHLAAVRTDEAQLVADHLRLFAQLQVVALLDDLDEGVDGVRAAARARLVGVETRHGVLARVEGDLVRRLHRHLRHGSEWVVGRREVRQQGGAVGHGEEGLHLVLLPLFLLPARLFPGILLPAVRLPVVLLPVGVQLLHGFVVAERLVSRRGVFRRVCHRLRGGLLADL